MKTSNGTRRIDTEDEIDKKSVAYLKSLVTARPAQGAEPFRIGPMELMEAYQSGARHYASKLKEANDNFLGVKSDLEYAEEKLAERDERIEKAIKELALPQWKHLKILGALKALRGEKT